MPHAAPHAANDELMDIHQQRAAYSTFVWGLKWLMVLHAAGGLFLVLWFATDVGFLGAVVSGAIAFALGVAWLRMGWRREHPSHHHPRR